MSSTYLRTLLSSWGLSTLTSFGGSPKRMFRLTRDMYGFPTFSSRTARVVKYFRLVEVFRSPSLMCFANSITSLYDIFAGSTVLTLPSTSSP